MELWRYYRILRRRRWLILFCVAACCIPVYVFTQFLTPDLYTGRTRVMERQPTEMGVPVYAQPYSMQGEVQIHLADLAHIATSNSVINRSVDTLSQLGITVDPENLIRTLKVEPVADTQILQIEVTSEIAEEAKSAADVVGAEFQRFYRELVSGATEQSREFIEKQLKDARAKLAEAREARKNYKESNELVELTAQQNVLIQRAAQIETEAIQSQVTSQDIDNRLNAIETQINAEPEMKLNSESTTNNPIYQDLLGRKIAIETELGAMLVRRGRNHPEVQTLQKQLDGIDAEIKKQAPKIVSSQTTALNPVFAQALQNRLSLKAEAAGASARRQALLNAVQEVQVKLNALPEQEMKMAQLELDVSAAEQTYGLLRAKLDEARIRVNETSKASAVQVIDPAYVYKVDPKTVMKLALALVLSPLLGAGIAFLLNYLDNTVKTPAEAEDLLGLPVVSVVPLARSHALVRRPDNEPLLATYEMITSALWREVAKTSSPFLVVASAEPDVGRSTTAANVAVTLARDGARVILVDADMRKPSMHLMFNTQSKPGLSNVLSAAVSIEDAVIPTKIEGLLLLPAGPAPDNPVRLLRSEQMAAFMKEIGGLADFVIFDTPAGITFADATVVASYAHNVVLVHAAGKVPRGAEAEFRGKLDFVGANVMGVVLNRVRPEDSHGYFHYRRFYKDMTIQSRTPTAISSEVRAIPPGGSGRGDAT